MTSSLILGAVLLTVGAIDGSARAVVSSESATTGLEVAESELETLRSVPFADLGVVKGSTGFVDSFEGRTTVVVDASPVSPKSTVVVDDTRFEVTRHVTDGALADPGQPPALKHLTVIVQWDDDRELRLDSAVATNCATTTTTTTLPIIPVPTITVPESTTTVPGSTTTTAPSGKDDKEDKDKDKDKDKNAKKDMDDKEKDKPGDGESPTTSVPALPEPTTPPVAAPPPGGTSC